MMYRDLIDPRYTVTMSQYLDKVWVGAQVLPSA